MPHTVAKREEIKVAVPIHDFELPHDVLWNIFMLNADMYIPTSPNLRDTSASGVQHIVLSALTVLRYSSQVSRSWRAIILQSPSLWSRVIDLDELRISALQWREKVMERTGDALLHVQGWIFGGDDRDEDLFKWFMVAFGARICNLDLLVEVDQQPYSRPCRISWDFLQNPVLSLESFKLHIFGTLPEAISNPSFSLFSNNAPALRSYFHVGIPFTIEAPWLSQLCSLYLCSEMPLARLFEILSRTPFLESLQVGENALAGARLEATIRRANLTYLKDISISAPLSTSVLLLDNIVPAQNCCLCLHTRSLGNRIEINMSTRIESVLSRYSHYYFDSNSPRYLSLEIYKSTLTLSARLQPIQNAIFPEFVLSVQGNWKKTLPNFLSSFSSFDLKCVTHLDLFMGAGVSNRKPETLLFTLTRVHELHITPNTLLILNDTKELFPRLHTLSFRSYHHNGARAVKKFLTSRKKFGPSTIHTLDFTRCRGLECLHPFDVEDLRKQPDVIMLRDVNMDL